MILSTAELSYILEQSLFPLDKTLANSTRFTGRKITLLFESDVDHTVEAFGLKLINLKFLYVRAGIIRNFLIVKHNLERGRFHYIVSLVLAHKMINSYIGPMFDLFEITPLLYGERYFSLILKYSLTILSILYLRNPSNYSSSTKMLYWEGLCDYDPYDLYQNLRLPPYDKHWLYFLANAKSLVLSY